jgi:hypothetical protein
MDKREERVDQCRPGEEPLSEPKRRPERPPAVADRVKYPVVDECKEQADPEVEDVAQRLG